MAVHGRNVQIFLMDNEPARRIKCTLANWTGITFKIPRTDLEICKDRPELKQSGVYFLFGRSDETGRDVVYIGQAGTRRTGEGLLSRVLEHRRNPDKDYWTEAVMLTTSNNFLGPTEISYLENRFCRIARTANRYDVKNENEPTQGTITEEKECEMEEFIDNAKLVIGVLGYKLFEPINSQVGQTPMFPDFPSKPGQVILRLERTVRDVGKVEATGMQTPDGFVVFKGSKISPTDDQTVPATIKSRRADAPVNGDQILQEDMLFNSPSYAAIFVIGKSANGLTSWKTSDGITLKELESNDTSV